MSISPLSLSHFFLQLLFTHVIISISLYVQVTCQTFTFLGFHSITLSGVAAVDDREMYDGMILKMQMQTVVGFDRAPRLRRFWTERGFCSHSQISRRH